MLSAIASVNKSIFGEKEDKNNSNLNVMSADQIALAEFKEKLGRYPELIKRYNKEPSMFLTLFCVLKAKNL